MSSPSAEIAGFGQGLLLFSRFRTLSRAALRLLDLVVLHVQIVLLVQLLLVLTLDLDGLDTVVSTAGTLEALELALRGVLGEPGPRALLARALAVRAFAGGRCVLVTIAVSAKDVRTLGDWIEGFEVELLAGRMDAIVSVLLFEVSQGAP